MWALKGHCQFLFFLFLVFEICALHGESDTPYPEILALSREDPLFLQLLDDITKSYQQIHRGESLASPLFFSYRPKSEETLFTIAARLNLPIDTIATLNRFSHPDEIENRSEIIIPNLPAIFLPHHPESDLELLMHSLRYIEDAGKEGVVVRSYEKEITYTYYPGERYNSIEYSLFLGILFRSPLTFGVISSGYGWRKHPVSGQSSFHSGIDIAAPQGSEVYPARSGEVIFTGFDSDLGLHVIIEHEGGYRTVYGHLREFFVRLNQTVSTGTIIGRVGSSGLSTGPHLHFEIRNRGTPRNPSDYLPEKIP